jgi:DNA invertase Pin-like site-specific DNA recombinase
MTMLKVKQGSTIRVVAYIRVSDESQVDGYSLDAQRKEIERWCERHGYVLTAVYADEGISAHTDKIEERPQLTKLLEDAKKGIFDCVVVHTLDRWARNVGVQRQALKLLGECNVGFASVTEDVDFSTPAGKLLLTTMGGVSEFFSDQLGVHVRKAQKQMAESGLPVAGIPFGYKRQPEKGLPPVKVDQEAKAVIEIFQRRAEGQSNGQIATWVNSQNFQTREGNFFTPHAIMDILNNHFYCGFVEYNEKLYQGKHEVIISQELFQRAQARKQPNKRVRQVHGAKGLLQGIVVCSTCGNRLHSDRKGQTTPMYRERHAHECPTNESSIIAAVFDKQVAALVHSLDIKPDWKQEMAKIAVSTYEGPKPEELNEKRRRLGKAYADGAFTDNEYNKRLAEIDRQIAQTAVVAPSAIEEAVELFSNIPMLWSEATQEERQLLLRSLVETVYVDIKTKRVTAIKPTPAFRVLYGVGINSGPDTPIKLMFHDKTPIKLDLVETGENQTARETRNVPEWVNSFEVKTC